MKNNRAVLVREVTHETVWSSEDLCNCKKENVTAYILFKIITQLMVFIHTYNVVHPSKQ